MLSAVARILAALGFSGQRDSDLAPPPPRCSCLLAEYGVRALASVVRVVKPTAATVTSVQPGTGGVYVRGFGGIFIALANRTDLVRWCHRSQSGALPTGFSLPRRRQHVLLSLSRLARRVHARARHRRLASPRSEALVPLFQNHLSDLRGQRVEGSGIVQLGAGPVRQVMRRDA